MKNVIKFWTGLLSVALVLTLGSCQEEFEEILTTEEEQTVDANSSTANLMASMATMDGSFDNIVDGSSCFAVQFPYTVTVNGIDIVIDEEEDLQRIEEIFDLLGDDDDVLDIIFPITITSQNFEDIVVNNEDELEALLEECKEGEDDDIECIDIVYPITIFTFNPNTEVTDTVVIESDLELHRFFRELDPAVLISIDWPVEIVYADGSSITVTNFAELASALNSARKACDEDDDNDYNDDDITEEELTALLLQCPWAVHDVKREQDDRTAARDGDDYDNYDDDEGNEYYSRYLIQFAEGGLATLFIGEETFEGQWSIGTTDRGLTLNIAFPGIDDLTIEGFVYKVRRRLIKIYAGEGHHVYLKKRCANDDDDDDGDDDDGDDDDGDDDDGDDFSDGDGLARLNNLLKECPWNFKKLIADGVELPGLENSTIFIKADGVVEVVNDETNEITQGTWDIREATSTENAKWIFVLSVPDIEVLNFEVPVRRFVKGILELEDVGAARLYRWEQRCNYQTDGDLVEITRLLKSGDWKVATYEMNGDDVTAQWEGYEFDFEHGGELDVEVNDNEVAEGKYRVARDEAGALKLILEFDEETPLPDFNYYWYIVGDNLTETSIEVVKETDNGNLRVVFEKIDEDDDDDDDDETSALIAELQDYLVSSDWNIASLTMSGDDVTAQYDGFVFRFNMEEEVVVTFGDSSVTGLYEIYDLGEGELKLEFDFEEGSALSDIDGYWYFDSESFTAETLEVASADGTVVVNFRVVNNNAE